MSCYCGCGSTGNKVKWGVFGGFCALAIIFLAIWLNNAVDIANQYKDCMEPFSILPTDSFVYQEAEKICKNYRDQEAKKSVAPYLILFIIFAIASSIPLYIMCCCTKKPEETEVHYAPITGQVVYPKF
eukprot:TRINITY_DN529_c0_g3_i1.p1 TRINITY_DN529_c0_g3~~TRINITY_DN529_c0_g3_i1.p1  ORF type:complete len:128 (+),score=12.05 TRINITY_DN529_c0_g3_i1:158-541(+)